MLLLGLVVMSHHVTLATRWGGAMIEAAWSRVCAAVGLQRQWEATMRASVSSVQRAAAGLSNLARSLLSLGMGANGYIPPTSDAAREQRGDPDHEKKI